jgi:hypothetical protein
LNWRWFLVKTGVADAEKGAILPRNRNNRLNAKAAPALWQTTIFRNFGGVLGFLIGRGGRI